jgi:hypothetical protein
MFNAVWERTLLAEWVAEVTKWICEPESETKLVPNIVFPVDGKTLPKEHGPPVEPTKPLGQLIIGVETAVGVAASVALGVTVELRVGVDVGGGSVDGVAVAVAVAVDPEQVGPVALDFHTPA